MSLNRTILKIFIILAFIHPIKRPIRSKASAILLVSLSAVGAERLADPKLLKSKAKNRLRTLNTKSLRLSGPRTISDGLREELCVRARLETI